MTTVNPSAPPLAPEKIIISLRLPNYGCCDSCACLVFCYCMPLRLGSIVVLGVAWVYCLIYTILSGIAYPNFVPFVVPGILLLILLSVGLYFAAISRNSMGLRIVGIIALVVGILSLGYAGLLALISAFLTFGFSEGGGGGGQAAIDRAHYMLTVFIMTFILCPLLITVFSVVNSYAKEIFDQDARRAAGLDGGLSTVVEVRKH